MKINGASGILTAFLSVVVALIGGADYLFGLMLMLIVFDVASGVVKAVIKNDLSSTKFREGVLTKCCMIAVVMLMVQCDGVLIEFVGHAFEIGSFNFGFRTLFLVWFCLQEIISVFENLACIGVPIPKFARKVLREVSDTVDNIDAEPIIDEVCDKLNIPRRNNDEPDDTDPG